MLSFSQGLVISCLALVYSVAGQVTEPSSTVLGAVSDVLDAGHILHFFGIVDAYGHASVRNPDNSSQFLMSVSIAPALATSQSIVTFVSFFVNLMSVGVTELLLHRYDINNATAVQLTVNTSVTGSDVPPGFVERFIHSEIYKTFPDIHGVVHSHTTEVLPFAGAHVPLRAQLTTGGSIGTKGTPIFDAGALPPSVLPKDALHDLLVRNEAIGQALAQTFSNDSQIVLMRGHGMAVRGVSVREAVFRAFYTRQNAIVQYRAMALGARPQDSGLKPREAMDAATTLESDPILERTWQLWTVQVDKDGLYTNDLRNGAKPPVPGF